MEAEMDNLKTIVLQQEGELNLLRQQNQQQQQQLQQQQQQQQQQPIQWLSNKDVIQQFRQLRQLDDQHDVLAFIKSVEFLMTLCQGDALLIRFGTSIVANEKVSGTAANFIRQLGMEPSWDQMKTKLMEQMRPRMTYEDVFDRCRFIKVSSLRDLFQEFEKAKCEINKIYMFDESKPAMYENDKVDRDLLNMLMNKIDTPFRIHVDQGISMHALQTKYSNIKALDDPRAILQKYRKNSNNTYNKQANTNTSTTHNNATQNNQFTSSNNNTKQNQGGRPNTNNNAGPPQSDQVNQQSYNRSQPTQNPNFKPNYNNKSNSSRQTRMSHMSVDTQKNDPTPMEIGTLEENQAEEEEEEQVNFLIPCLEQPYP